LKRDLNWGEGDKAKRNKCEKALNNKGNGKKTNKLLGERIARSRVKVPACTRKKGTGVRVEGRLARRGKKCEKNPKNLGMG